MMWDMRHETRDTDVMIDGDERWMLGLIKEAGIGTKYAAGRAKCLLLKRVRDDRPNDV